MLQDVTSNLVSVRREVAGGNGRFYELRVKPYLTSEKKIDGAILIFVDITERKLLENERSRHTGDLEFQLTEQALKLVQSERLANIGETAGMVGHDLRNPLQAITGEVYLAKSELKALPEGEQKTNLQENMAAIEEQTRYMDKIVSDLQTFFKPVEAHKQTVKLKQLIDRVLAKVNIPKNIQISLQVDEELTANADSQLLKRVLINLATNAVQAMPKGGKLTIKAHAGEKEQVQIIVEDTGVGIPEEIKPKLFTPLFTTKSKGQGFGLAVCKRVIEAQDGTIDFESQEGKGTKFTVSLPAQKAKENT